MRSFLAAIAACVAASAVAALPSITIDGAEHRPVPGLGALPAHCVNEVPSGTRSRRAPGGGLEATFPDGTVHRFPPCSETAPRVRGSVSMPTLPADYDGWLAYTATKATGAAYDSFLGSFSTPDAPQETPQVLYLFTGLQNINWIPKADPDPSTDFDIIQPVLQYPASDGYSWSARSWYVTFRDGALASTEISMSEGDLVFGNMTRTGDQSWDVISTNTRTGKSTLQSATNSRLQSQPWGYNTLECYGCQGCGTFPQKPSVFTGIKLTAAGLPVKADWDITPVKPVTPMCKAKASVDSSSGVVTLSFR